MGASGFGASLECGTGRLHSHEVVATLWLPAPLFWERQRPIPHARAGIPSLGEQANPATHALEAASQSRVVEVLMPWSPPALMSPLLRPAICSGGLVRLPR